VNQLASVIIEVSELARSFDAVIAVAGVSFEVAEGEVFGFLGPNAVGRVVSVVPRRGCA